MRSLFLVQTQIYALQICPIIHYKSAMFIGIADNRGMWYNGEN